MSVSFLQSFFSDSYPLLDVAVVRVGFFFVHFLPSISEVPPPHFANEYILPLPAYR